MTTSTGDFTIRKLIQYHVKNRTRLYRPARLYRFIKCVLSPVHRVEYLRLMELLHAARVQTDLRIRSSKSSPPPIVLDGNGNYYIGLFDRLNNEFFSNELPYPAFIRIVRNNAPFTEDQYSDSHGLFSYSDEGNAAAIIVRLYDNDTSLLYFEHILLHEMIHLNQWIKGDLNGGGSHDTELWISECNRIAGLMKIPAPVTPEDLATFPYYAFNQYYDERGQPSFTLFQ